jgi:RimJ/RimL family protein N-acetyltransferase
MRLLNKQEYSTVVDHLNNVSFNHYFARDVISQKVNGIVYSDDSESPTTFYIIHPYGVSLLLGDYENKEFNQQLCQSLLNTDHLRSQTEWMQVYPLAWNHKLEDLLGDDLLTKSRKARGVPYNSEVIKIVEETRVNFRFNPEKYAAFRTNHPNRHNDIFRTGSLEFETMPGSVVPRFFWRDYPLFEEQGVGFSLRINGELASTAFSAYLDDHYLEFGIESAPQFRSLGLAKETCSALIDYCLANNSVPGWACRGENTGSFLLAQQLGFEPVSYHPYYKINA